MPYTDAHDPNWALSNSLVEFRQEERQWAIGRYECHDPEDTWIRDQQEQFCTGDDQCRAEPDAHHDDCPVECRLRDEFGF